MEIQGLSVGYVGADGRVNPVVSDLDLRLDPGQVLGLAGESGCGKSTAALAAVGYKTPGMRVLSGRSMLGELDLLAQPTARLRSIWGRRVAYVAQQATAALNPAMPVGRQLAQPLAVHLGLRGTELHERQVELLRMVRIPDPETALSRYPHQFSGGQQQRIALAVALSCRPEVLILDEPTTGLDVTTQAQIAALLVSLVAEIGFATLYVSHDLGLLNQLTDRIVVMYAGQIAESGATRAVLQQPRHPYTGALLAAVPNVRRPGLIAGIPGRPPTSVVLDSCAYAPRCQHATDACRTNAIALRDIDDRLVRCTRAEEVTAEVRAASALPRSSYGETLLEVAGLWCTYRKAKDPVVKDVSFTIRSGETLGIVGESGSGKSTLLRAIIGLHSPSAGAILFRGLALPPRAGKRPRAIRRQLQIIFQDPDSSLNPRHTIGSIVARPIRLFRNDIPRRNEQEAVAEILEAVRLSRGVRERYPHELSGGQKQRVAIARAFAAKPSVLLCDEITSALDVSVQAAILELLAELSVQTGTAVVFVAHDLAVVRTIASRTVVMRQGEVCEAGSTDEIFRTPQNPYTQALLNAIPELPAAAVSSSSALIDD